MISKKEFIISLIEYSCGWICMAGLIYVYDYAWGGSISWWAYFTCVFSMYAVILHCGNKAEQICTYLKEQKRT